MPSAQQIQDTLESVRTSAERSGAAEAETYFEFITTAEARYREREVELLTQSAITGFGLRVLVDRRMGFMYTTDFRRPTLDELTQRTIALASQATPRDENKLPEQTFQAAGNLEINDDAIIAMKPDDLIPLASSLEDIAVAADRRIQAVRTARAGYAIGQVHFSNTFIPYEAYSSTTCWLTCTAVATQNGQKREGTYSDRKRIFADLVTPERIARKASERALGKLGAKAIPSMKAPVVFEAEATGAFVGGLFSAFNGLNVLDQRSYLAGRKGQPIASPLVTIVDDGILRRGLNSRPFDGEGSATHRNVLVDRGVLMRFLHNVSTARRENVAPTGNAVRGYDSLPVVGPTNFYMDRGNGKTDSMIGEISRGLFVTGTAGMGLDVVSGEYSAQVEGFLIEGGNLTSPVEGVTVAGKLDDMLMGVDAVDRNVEFRAPFAAPTIRFKQLTIGGA